MKLSEIHSCDKPSPHDILASEDEPLFEQGNSVARLSENVEEARHDRAKLDDGFRDEHPILTNLPDVTAETFSHAAELPREGKKTPSPPSAAATEQDENHIFCSLGLRSSSKDAVVRFDGKSALEDSKRCDSDDIAADHFKPAKEEEWDAGKVIEIEPLSCFMAFRSKTTVDMDQTKLPGKRKDACFQEDIETVNCTPKKMKMVISHPAEKNMVQLTLSG